MKPTIICISGKARHGKDTTCDFIQNKTNKKCLHINYGDYVKFLYSMYFGGKQDTMFDRTESNRTGWQQFGTNITRTINDDFWVNAVVNIINTYSQYYNYDYILISDVRFLNEIDIWKKNNYTVIPIRVVRLNFDNGLTEEQKAHKSETALDDYNFKYRLIAETLSELEEEVDKKLSFLF